MSKEQLDAIVRSNPDFLLYHIEQDTNYDAKLVRKVFELGKERAAALLAMPTPQPAAGDVWFVKLPGAIALTEVRVREATERSVLTSVNGDWRDTRYAIADLTWVEKKA
jgi:hypothetical protein